MPRFESTPAQSASGDGPYLSPDLNLIYQHYYQRFTAAALTRYRWLGLGPNVDPMRLEFLLCTQGLAAFTHVQRKSPLGLDLTALPESAVRGDVELERRRREGLEDIASERFTITHAVVTGFLDDTYTPAGYATYAPNGAGGITFRTTEPLKEWKGVPIWGDAMRSNYDATTIALFARRVASAALVVDTNLLNTMRGVMAATTQDKLKTTRVALEGVRQGIDVFVADQGTIDSLKALDFGVHPDTVERSHVISERLVKEAYEALGVQAPAAEKKERLIVDEADHDDSVAAIRRLTLTPRRQAASLINRRYFGGKTVVEVVDQW